MKHWLHSFRLRMLPLAVSSIIVGSALFVAGCSSHQEQGRERPTVDTSWTDIGAIQVNGRSYDVVHASDTLFILEHGNVIFKHEALTISIDLIDFDGDGAQDILLMYNTNVPGIHDLIRYSAETGSFHLVEGFTRFPEPIKIPGYDCFYSYHRSGCADLNWDSDLFIIEQNTAIRRGNIHGHGCDYENPSPMIRISMTDIEGKLLSPPVDSMPIDSAWSYSGSKWEFIERYWNRNHPKFIQR